MTMVAAQQNDAPHRRRFRVTIAVVGLGQLITLLNSTIFVTALPIVMHDLGMSPTEASWVFTGTMLMLTVGSPIWGRLADRYSPIALIRIAMVIILIGAIIGSVAPSSGVLILARVVQGAGFGGVVSLGAIVLANIIPPRERGKYFGLMAALQLGGQLGGPLLGGLLVQSPLGWRACFYVIIPLIVTILVLTFLALPLRKEDIRTTRIDWPGAILLSIGVASILVWVTFVGDAFEVVSWSSLLLLAGGLLVVALALGVELRAANPILPIRAMAGRVPVMLSFSAFATGMASMPLTLFVSYYLQIGRGVSPALSGLIILASAVGVVTASFVVGARSGRTGRLRRYLVVGAACLVLGTVGLATLGPNTPFWQIIPLLVLCGVGQGATVQFFILAAQNTVGMSEVGSVTGFISFAQLFGSTLGLSLITAIAAARIESLEAGGLTEAVAYATSVPGNFFISAGLAVIVLILVVLLPSIRLRQTLDLDRDPEPR